MRICCTRSNEETGTLRIDPPLTETEPVHPGSQATERMTVAAEGVTTRICSDFVELETTATGSRRPAVVTAEMGSGAFCSVKTAYPWEKPASRHGPGTSAEESEPPSA